MKHSSNPVHRLSSIIKKNSRRPDNDHSLNDRLPNRIIGNEKNVARQSSNIFSADSTYIKTKADEDRPE